MEPQQALGVTKEALASCPALLLVVSQDLVLVKEDLVVVQVLTRIIQAVVPVVVIQEVPQPTTEQILKAAAVVLLTLELAK
jgi:hypothetical protein